MNAQLLLLVIAFVAFLIGLLDYPARERDQVRVSGTGVDNAGAAYSLKEANVQQYSIFGR